jgi:hypothetical protein
MADPIQPIERFHASEPIRGSQYVAESVLYEGRFGRMFRNLSEPTIRVSDQRLKELADTMIEDPATADDDEGDGEIPAGFTYLGQFVDHDITFDPNSQLQRDNDPNALQNFRTPRFDLDSVYGAGRDDDPFLYRADGVHFLLGTSEDVPAEEDLPRNVPAAGEDARALIGDPRNDENLIVAQLHLGFLKFHNKVADRLKARSPGRFPDTARGRKRLFDETRREVRWHYQWVVVQDFLRQIAGNPVVDDVLKTEAIVTSTGTVNRLTADLKFFHWRNRPFMPIEFAVAAYRFGHSMVRTDYELNEDAEDLPIFGPNKATDLRGFRRRPADRTIEWKRFFEVSGSDEEDEGEPVLQKVRKINPKIAVGLGNLPVPVVPEGSAPNNFGSPTSLAARNLLRGKALGLPTGQAVARAMGIEPLTSGQLDIPDSPDAAHPDELRTTFNRNTPLWFYILREAEFQHDGEKLGDVGGRIVAEVLVGLLAGDPQSFLSVEPNWVPEPNEFGAKGEDVEPKDRFKMADLIAFAFDL